MVAICIKPHRLLILALFMGAQCVMAQTSTATVSVQNSGMAQGTSVVSPMKKKKTGETSNLNIGFDLKAINYTEASAVDNAFQQQAQIGLKYKKTGAVFSEAELIIGTFSQPNSMYYSFSQAYLAYGLAESFVAVGRKKENLSFADDFFNLGLVQAHATNDNLEYETGGLTGISGKLGNKDMGVLVAFNPIFIPNQGPQTTAEGGKIISTNRWAPAPPSKYMFGDEFHNINYAIRDYKITDIISNSGYMINGFYGMNKTRPMLVATFAKKPINEIALSRDTFSDISTLEGYVFLTPVVLNHQVQALDFNFDYENLKTSLSYLADTPENKNASDLEFIQTLEPMQVVSAYLALDLSFQFSRKFDVYLAAANISGGKIQDLDKDKKVSNVAIANSRSLFKKPIKVGLATEAFYIYNKAVETDVNLTYDQELKGSLMGLKINYAASKNLKLSIGADIIGVENDLPEEAQGNFLDQNKANDRFSAGVNYVF